MSITKSTIVVYPYSGDTNELTIPFDYLKRDFVVVALGAEGKPQKALKLGSDYRFATKTTIVITRQYQPEEGYNKIIVRRVTDASKRIINYQDGSILNASELNTSQLQALHVAEEARDLANYTLFVDDNNNLDARGRRIINVGDPVSNKDAVNKDYIDNAAGSVIDSKNKALQYRNEAEGFRDEARGFRDEAEAFKNTADSKATEITNKIAKADELNQQAIANSNKAQQYALNAQQSASAASEAEKKAKASDKNASISADKAKEEAMKAEHFATTVNPSNLVLKTDTLITLGTLSLLEGTIIEVEGVKTKGDGLHHKRQIAQSDNGSGILLANGLYANIIHGGSILLDWFDGDYLKGLKYAFKDKTVSNVSCKEAKDITIDSTLDCRHRLDMNLNNCTFIFNDSNVMHSINYYSDEEPRQIPNEEINQLGNTRVSLFDGQPDNTVIIIRDIDPWCTAGREVIRNECNLKITTKTFIRPFYTPYDSSGRYETFVRPLDAGSVWKNFNFKLNYSKTYNASLIWLLQIFRDNTEVKNITFNVTDNGPTNDFKGWRGSLIRVKDCIGVTLDHIYSTGWGSRLYSNSQTGYTLYNQNTTNLSLLDCVFSTVGGSTGSNSSFMLKVKGCVLGRLDGHTYCGDWFVSDCSFEAKERGAGEGGIAYPEMYGTLYISNCTFFNARVIARSDYKAGHFGTIVVTDCDFRGDVGDYGFFYHSVYNDGVGYRGVLKDPDVVLTNIRAKDAHQNITLSNTGKSTLSGSLYMNNVVVEKSCNTSLKASLSRVCVTDSVLHNDLDSILTAVTDSFTIYKAKSVFDLGVSTIDEVTVQNTRIHLRADICTFKTLKADRMTGLADVYKDHIDKNVSISNSTLYSIIATSSASEVVYYGGELLVHNLNNVYIKTLPLSTTPSATLTFKRRSYEYNLITDCNLNNVYYVRNPKVNYSGFDNFPLDKFIFKRVGESLTPTLYVEIEEELLNSTILDEEDYMEMV